jgi:prepilin-type N-terminal cleavage/methylation domain-containing protein
MMRAPRGFTLLEVVIVVVILGIAAAAVVTMVANVGARQTDNSDLQVGTQLLQECAENIVSQHRRDENFFSTTSGTGSANCYSLTTFGSFDAPSVTMAGYTGAGCPTGAVCKTAAVTISKGGVALNTVTFMLVKYN